jgi:hypothetical protein
MSLVQGISIMLLENSTPTLPSNSREALKHVSRGDGQSRISDLDQVGNFEGVHLFVEQEMVATYGNMCKSLPDELSRYPIPYLPLANTENGSFLDAGRNWTRWALATSALGYPAVGLGLSLKAALAGSRVAYDLARDVYFIVNPWLLFLADSLWVESKNDADEPAAPNAIGISGRSS